MDIKPFSKKVYLSSPTMHGEELKYIQEAFDTNWLSTVGKNIDECEKLISEKIGVKYAVALCNGTCALHLATRLNNLKPGEKVFCSDMTFAATVNPVKYEGAEAVFIDTESDTWNMDPEALERAFTLYPGTRLVVVAHLYGTPGKIDEIRKVCDKHGAKILEDAAESFGATYKGKETGSFGDNAVISFNGNKIITGSSGGMFLTNKKEEADKVRKWSTQSRDPFPWYEHTELGYNYRMSNIIAGVVRGQIPHLHEHIDAKKAIYYRYKEGLKDLPLKMNPFDEKNSVPNYWLSCAIIDKGCDVKPLTILEKIAANNAEGRPIWKPMHMQPIYKNNKFVAAEDGKDTSKDIFERGLCLPSDNKMTVEEQEMIIEIIKSCFIK